MSHILLSRRRTRKYHGIGALSLLCSEWEEVGTPNEAPTSKSRFSFLILFVEKK